MAMDSSNYVAPYGNGWVVVVKGQYRDANGNPTSEPYIFTSQSQAENTFNIATEATGGGGSTQPAPAAPAPATQPTSPIQSGIEWAMEQAPIDIWDMQGDVVLAMIQDKYLRDRMNLLEIPESKAMTDIQRRQIALQAIIQFAEQTGWINPAQLQMFLEWENNTFGDGPGGAQQTWKTINGDLTIDQMRADLIRAAGGGEMWENHFGNMTPEQIAEEYGKVSDPTGSFGPVTPNVSASAANTAALNAGQAGSIPTIGGAARAANNYGLEQNMGLLGLDTSILPMYNDESLTPTLALQDIFSKPQNIVQSMLLSGMTEQQVIDALNNSPVVQQLMAAVNAGNNDNYGIRPNPSPNIPGDLIDKLRNAPISLLQPSPYGHPNHVGYGTPENPVYVGRPVSPPVQFDPNNPPIQFDPNNPGAIPSPSNDLTSFTPTFAPMGSGTTVQPNQFSFVQGHQLPMRETMRMLQRNDPMIGIYTGLAAYAGQDPSQFWGQFQSALPTGSKNPLTRFL